FSEAVAHVQERGHHVLQAAQGGGAREGQLERALRALHLLEGRRELETGGEGARDLPQVGQGVGDGTGRVGGVVEQDQPLQAPRGRPGGGSQKEAWEPPAMAAIRSSTPSREEARGLPARMSWAASRVFCRSSRRLRARSRSSRRSVRAEPSWAEASA